MDASRAALSHVDPRPENLPRTVLSVARVRVTRVSPSQSTNRMTSRGLRALWQHADKQSHPWHPLDLADAQEACEAYAAYAQHTLVSTRRALGCRGAPCNQS